MRLVLEAPGGVDDQAVDPGGGGLLHAVEDDTSGVAAFLAADHRRTDPFAPDAQLLYRGGAEGVAGGQHHAIVLFLQQVAQLADGGGLARPIDADHQDNMRPGKSPHVQRLGHGAEDLLDLLGQDGPQAALIQLLVAAGGDGVADTLRGLRPEVGRDQRFLDVVQRRGIERSPAGQAGQIVAETISGLLEAAGQAVEPTHSVKLPVRWSAVRPVMRTGPVCPRTDPATNTGAKLSV